MPSLISVLRGLSRSLAPSPGAAPAVASSAPGRVVVGADQVGAYAPALQPPVATFSPAYVAPGGSGASSSILRMGGQWAAQEERALQRLYTVLRAVIPVINASIVNRRFLEGQIVVESPDAQVQGAVTDFVRRVPVGSFEITQLRQGLDVALDAASESADEVGTGFLEYVPPDPANPFGRVLTPKSSDFDFQLVRRGEGAAGIEYWRLMYRGTAGAVPVDNGLVSALTFSDQAASPWGRGIVWGLPFVAELWVRILNSLSNMWLKGGDPSTLYAVEYDARADGTVPTGPEVAADIAVLESTIARVMAARMEGKAADAFFGVPGGKVNAQQVGHSVISGSLANYVQSHYNVVAGQVVANANVPSFMYPASMLPADGIGSDRAETEARLCMRAAAQRNARRETLARFVIDSYLLYTGRGAAIGRYDVRFTSPDISNPKFLAEARKADAEASAAHIDNALLLRDSGVISENSLAEYLISRGVLRPGEDA